MLSISSTNKVQIFYHFHAIHVKNRIQNNLVPQLHVHSVVVSRYYYSIRAYEVSTNGNDTYMSSHLSALLWS